ncbi:unnamed protein product [Vitrella brassicaformis CCMP3155]|uniref:PARP catalytic domain-containing protein n=1 Tax=Vitrella brassicaformis (strain CCMP3155) TaxID=1169540 RepID=A0A0G4FE25_VITBC|nr:unnamed protein product [Vitrella brassicaformis CCMP3155]|eukprot:CEM11115.1 unnamed protein product [Vitrella brassicaformis CCMP3155]
MFGPGIYVTRDYSKATAFARHHRKGTVLTLAVDMGKCKTHDASGCSGGHTWFCSCRKWREEGYDSQYVPRGEGVLREENVVRSNEQIIVTGLTDIS